MSKNSGGEGEIVVNASMPDGPPVGALSGIGLTIGADAIEHYRRLRERSYAEARVVEHAS